MAEVLLTDPSLLRRSGKGAVTVLHAPSAAWCEPLMEAWCAAVLDGHVPAWRRNRNRQTSDWHEEVATEPVKRSSKQAVEAATALQEAVRLGNGALGVSQDPDTCLSRGLLATADNRVRLREPTVADLHLIAAELTNGTCPPLGRPPEPLSPAHLRLAVRPGQGPGD